jgi:hypothetical protein
MMGTYDSRAAAPFVVVENRLLRARFSRSAAGGNDDMTAFWSSWVWPLATAVLGFFYSYLLIRQWLDRRKPHQLAWFAGFMFYAIAALMEAYSEGTGTWFPPVYRVYIVMAASMVGFLGLGSLYLITRDRIWGHLYLAFNLVALAIFFYGTWNARLDMSQLVAGITVGGRPLGRAGEFPRVMSLVFNIPGTLLLLGASVLSIVRFLPKRLFRYRVWANVLIILGTLVIAAAGSFARGGQTAGLYPAEMVGAALLLWGFIKASTLEKGAEMARQERESGGQR